MATEILTILYLSIPLVIWSMFWKGWGLWRAGNRKDKAWFIILFILNTAGILPIIYLYITRKKPKKSKR